MKEPADIPKFARRDSAISIRCRQRRPCRMYFSQESAHKVETRLANITHNTKLAADHESAELAVAQ